MSPMVMPKDLAPCFTRTFFSSLPGLKLSAMSRVPGYVFISAFNSSAASLSCLKSFPASWISMGFPAGPPSMVENVSVSMPGTSPTWLRHSFKIVFTERDGRFSELASSIQTSPT